jgi:hypothetical protein
MRHHNEGHKPGTPGMHEEEEPNEEVEKRGGRAGHARGGRTEHVNEYNAEGSPTMKEAKDEEPDFARGGKTRRRHARGGAVQGAMADMRADRPRRGLGGVVPAQTLARGGLARGGRHEEEREEHKRGGAVSAKGFARGGLARGGRHEEEEREEHKRGGAVSGKSETPGLARGGRAAHSPYSSGRHLNPPEDAKGSRGYEGISVPPEKE